MSRKIVALLIAALTAGTTGYAVFAQQPRRGPEWNTFKPVKEGKKWQYCTFTVAKLDDKDRLVVVVEGAALTGICNGGWIEAAEKLGQKIGPNYPHKNDGWERQHALDQMGMMGWELVGTHREDSDRTIWVFKREL